MPTLDTELVRNHDESGKLPIHIACRNKAPVEVLVLIVEMDFSTVRFLVEQGGVGTLAARNQDGALPLHNLCGSTNPSLRIVQYLIQSFPGSVEVQTNSGEYPFMIAASETSTASLSVIYELVRASSSVL